ncbi:MAG: transporter [Sphingomonadales bacterium]|jgi:hypothetical protein
MTIPRSRRARSSGSELRPALLALLLAASPAAAQSVVPTSSDADAPICTDRPTKSNFACTVPRGQVQIEADALAWQNDVAGNSRSDQWALASATYKYGLSGRTDIELAWAPLVSRRERGGADVVTQTGISEATVRLKQRLTASDASVTAALLPFLKLPLAPRGLGNRRVEGGVALPVNIAVPGGWTLTLGPQIDILADASGHGHHGGATMLINVARQLGAFTLYSELWARRDWDPAGTVRQHSADVAIAWLATPRLQLDVGANIGLDRATPGLVAYLGVATRF